MEPDGAYDVMDLKALRCFWAMARHGSLTRAGIELGISEAAVSQRLKALEGSLAVKLYEARGGRVRLTAAGQRAMELAISLFDWLEEFRRTVSGEAAAGALTLATHDPVLRHLLPDVVHRFAREYPRVRLRLLGRTPRDTVELVRRNEVDVGVVPRRPLPPDLVFHPWRTYDAYLVIPKGHPLVRRGIPPLQDLLNPATATQHPLIVPEMEDWDHHRLVRGLRQEGLPVHVQLEVGTIETVKYYVARGLGIAVVPGLCLTADDRTRLEAIQIPAKYDSATTYGVVLRGDKHLTPPLAGLLAVLGLHDRPRPDSKGQSPRRRPG